jgi:hypothetical protein
MQSTPPHLIPTRSFLMLSPIYVLVFLVVSFPLTFLSITYTRSSSPPFAPHVPPTSSSSTHHSNYRDEYNSSSSSLCRFLHPPVTSVLFGPNILFITLFSNTPSLCSSLIIRDPVPHPYRTKDKIILSVLITYKVPV